MAMKNIWVLVAERSRARLFELDSPTSALREIQDWADTQARLQKSQYGTSEAHGRAFDSMGMQRHAMEPRTDIKRKEAGRFAAELVQALKEGQAHGRFEGLILVASAEMLGLLHGHMDDTLRASVAGEVRKSLAKRSADTIRSHLPTPPVHEQRRASTP